MRVVAVVNQKGGVGKTTTTVNLAHALAKRGHRVTAVDLDPQGHLSPSFGLFNVPGSGISDVLNQGAGIDAKGIPVRDWCTLIPCGDALIDFEHSPGTPDRARLLKMALAESGADNDFVLIDCPPSSGMLTVNAITAADDVLIPVSGDYLSLTGLARLMLTMKRLQPMCSAELNKWVFLNRFVPRRRLAREVHGKLQLHFPNSLLHTSVNEAAALAECAGVGKTIFEYRSRSRSAREYDDLAEDLLLGRVLTNEQEETSDVA